MKYFLIHKRKEWLSTFTDVSREEGVLVQFPNKSWEMGINSYA